MDTRHLSHGGSTSWRHLVRPLLRSVSTVATVVALYFVLPLSGRDVRAIVLLAVGLVAVGALGAWQIRTILRSPHPVVQGVQAIAAAVPLYWLVFATTYYLMSANAPSSFSEKLDRIDALYFTVTVFATVGFGDIAAVTPPARVVVLVQMVANLLVLGLLLRAVTGAVRVNRRHATVATDQQRDEERAR